MLSIGWKFQYLKALQKEENSEKTVLLETYTRKSHNFYDIIILLNLEITLVLWVGIIIT